jgi:hypothetical protein
MTAAECAAHDLSQVELSLITPEEEPLGIFGSPASAAIRRLLNDSGVTLHTSSYGVPSGTGWLDIAPGGRRLPADRIVTQPRLIGPRLRGIPAGPDGFTTPSRTSGSPDATTSSPQATPPPSR